MISFQRKQHWVYVAENVVKNERWFKPVYIFCPTGQAKMRQLFDDLLELQQMLLSRNKELSFLVGGDGGNHGNEDEDEEVPSDLDDDVDSDDINSNDTKNSNKSDSEEDDVISDTSSPVARRKRKRKHREWVSGRTHICG